VTFKDSFQDSLEKLDLQGIVLIQGLLAQRALELMAKPKPESKIVTPDKSLIV